MNTARYIIALVMFMSLPPGLVFWFVIHPFVAFWRRLGVATTYLIVTPMIFLTMYGLYLVRDPVLAVEFGTNYYLWPLVILSYGVSMAIEIACRRHLKLKTLFGAPELNPSGTGGALLSDGIYSRVRHPRYIGVIFGQVAFALFTNYLAMYVMVPFVLIGVYLLTIIEERELVDRFGEQYLDYQRRVPRLIPRRV